MDRVGNVAMLNAIIGRCQNEPFVPNDLFQLGYTQIAIERPVAFADGKEVVPDLAIGSGTLNGACCFESKTGRNIDAPQARKYAQLTPQHLERYCRFTLDYTRAVTVDVGYLCPDDAECVDGITMDLDREGLPFPLLPVGAQIALARGRFNEPQLHSLFATRLTMDFAKVPPYYHFDKVSRLFEMAPWVVQSLVAFAQQGNIPFRTAAIAADAYGPLWHVTGAGQQNTVIKKTGQVLRAAMVKELKSFLERADAKKTVNRNTEWTLRYANATGNAYPFQRLKSLDKACVRFVNRLESEELGTLPGMWRYLFP